MNPQLQTQSINGLAPSFAPLLLADGDGGAKVPLEPPRLLVNRASNLVLWAGRLYQLSEEHMKVFMLLLKAYEEGMPVVSWHELRIKGHVGAHELGRVFKRGGKPHPIWGSLIIRIER